MKKRVHNLLNLLQSTSVYDWKFSFSYCPLCCRKTPFISFKRTVIATRCLFCSNTCVNLSLIPVIRNILPVSSAYEMSSYGGTHDFLKQNVPYLQISEFYPNHKLGSFVNGIRNEDVQKLTFKDESFDLVTSNQVMEHVPDDIAGYKEIYRILKPEGFFIFSVPLFNIEKTIQRAAIFNGSIKHFEIPEYHGSRLEGPKSVLTFWKHSSNDITSRLNKVGFFTKIVEVSITAIQGEPYKVLKCQK